MRIEKLNKDKIRVTLTSADLISLDIDVERLSPDSKELHTFLFHIMETIREETGFNPYSGQVIVEATPSTDGISIIVRRLGKISSKISKAEFKSAKAVNARVKHSENVDIFYFENFNDMCEALSRVDYSALASGSLYKLNDTYCFAIESDNKYIACYSVMIEFSSKYSTYPLQLSYIKEHGQLIAKGEKLAVMAEKVRRLI